MGVQRKRRRREERLEEEEAQGREPAEENVLEKERPKEKEGTVADRVLDLQKTAGNRATTEAIARWGLPDAPALGGPAMAEGASGDHRRRRDPAAGVVDDGGARGAPRDRTGRISTTSTSSRRSGTTAPI